MRSGLVAALALLALTGGSAAAEAPKPKLLPLHPRELGDSPHIAGAFKGRYIVDTSSPGLLSVLDDVAGRRYAQAVPADCLVQDVRLPEALLNCPDPGAEFPSTRRPLIVNLRDGRQATLRRGGGPFPRKAGYEPGSYHRLGRRWIEGTFEGCDIAHNPTAFVYLNRLSGERREACAPQRLDLDSPDLAPDYPPHACRGFGREFLDPSTVRWLSRDSRTRNHLVLRRCGKRARLISRCPDGCNQFKLTRRFVVWAGNETAVIHSIRSGRRFKLRFPDYSYDSARTGYGVLLAVTDRRVRISLARLRRTEFEPFRFRVIEVRLPRSLR